MIKNIRHAHVLSLADQVKSLPGQIVSKTLAQNEHISLTLFAFDKDEEIGAHDSQGDAMVTILSGTGIITIDGTQHEVSTGQSIVMPAQVPHIVMAMEPFKMLLTVVFPEP